MMNSRKRPAPGTSPIATNQQLQQSFGSPQPITNDQFLRWGQNGDSMAFPTDVSGFNIDPYGANALSNSQFPASVSAPSTQLARRPVNRQLVATQQRPMYENLGDPWGALVDGGAFDVQNGVMEENDNIELLEERAAVAKRDAQSKRKQIPPFVQKLSR